MDEQPEVSTTDSTYDAEWLSAHRTSPEQEETKNWVADRNQDIEASSRLKAALSSNPGIYDEYAKQIEAMDPAWKLELSNRHPDEIQAVLDDLAEDEAATKRVTDELEKAEAEREEATLASRETGGQSEYRKQFTQKTAEAAKIEEDIQELRRLNELRDDPANEGWDKLSAEDWKKAREGTLESKDAEIARLVQERQAKLQEAALYQDGYHEANRQMQQQQPVAQPIGQSYGMTEDDKQQMQRDLQAYTERLPEARKRYADWDQAFQNAGNIPLPEDQLAVVAALPNNIDVVYHLITHPLEARGLSQLPKAAATKELIHLSHRVKGRSQEEPKKSAWTYKPISPVGGGGHRGIFDVNDENISPDEWLTKRRAQVARNGGY